MSPFVRRARASASGCTAPEKAACRHWTHRMRTTTRQGVHHGRGACASRGASMRITIRLGSMRTSQAKRSGLLACACVTESVHPLGRSHAHAETFQCPRAPDCMRTRRAFGMHAGMSRDARALDRTRILARSRARANRIGCARDGPSAHTGSRSHAHARTGTWQTGPLMPSMRTPRNAHRHGSRCTRSLLSVPRG